jgi:hypothetical protein
MEEEAMKQKLFTLLALFLILGLLPPASPAPASAVVQESTPPETSAPDATATEQAFRSSPVMFIENVGQFDDRARFQVRGGMGTMWLAEDASYTKQ